MTRKIFRHILFTVLFSMVVMISLFLNVLYGYFEGQVRQDFVQDLSYIAKGYENEGISYFENLRSEDRITLIDKSGNVIFDNRVNNDEMENHLEREEIKEALETGEGFAKRRSTTLGYQSLYWAKRLDDGSILRLSTSRRTVASLLLGMSSHIFWILLLVILMALLFAKRAADVIVKPINEMNLENYNQVAVYGELQPLLYRIQTQRQTIERQLKEQKAKEEELSLITENMEEGLLVINQKAEVLSYNKSVLDIFHLEEVNEKESVFHFYHGSEFMEAIDEVLKKGIHKVLEIQQNHRIYEIGINPVLLQGKINGATILLRDISEKSEQEQLRREFSANVSHELKTPLTSILGFAEIMEKGMVDEKDTKEIAGDIHKEAKRLIHLVNDIIHLSSLEDGKMKEVKQDYDLASIIEDVITSLRPLALKKNITLHVEAKSIVMSMFPSVMEEVIFNLVDNAIQYGKTGGRVDVKVLEKDKEVILMIEDDGIGIPYEDRGRIFERFYRVDKSHSKNLGGTGLGLSIVKHGVWLHEGKITLTSKENVGTVFTIVLPLIQEKEGLL